MDELTDEESGILLANMQADGRVQKARALKATEFLPMPKVKLDMGAIRRARFYSALLDGELPATAIGRTPMVRAKPDTVNGWINRPTFQRIVQQAFGTAGLTPARIAAKISEKMDAEVVKFLPDGRGGWDERRVPDNDAQIKATRLAHDILLATTESAPAERPEVEQLAEGLKELSLDELQRRAVEVNAGTADARHRGGRAAQRR